MKLLSLFFNMKGLQKIHQKLNLLSLDVVFGAVAGMVFFSTVLGVHPRALEYLLLALAVWGVYTLDHLIDVWSLKEIAQTKRHSFHQKYFKTIFACWGTMGLLGTALVILSESLHYVLLPGLALGVTMVLWMVVIRKLVPQAVWLKEISIALFYVLGILLVPFLKADRELINSSSYFLAFGYVLVAWLNLLILSYQDRDSDKKDGFESILSFLSKGQLEVLIIGLGVFGGMYFVGLLLWLPSYFHIFSGILLLILLFHAIQFLKAGQNPELMRRRLELSFLLPFLLLLFN
ncbi:hypothetical protein SAMN05444412_102223 [Rhodonellum ikkaensis]|nr:hypothetical protein SAMN05444412_102223 [Rhodonellum ikkaensis]